MKPRSRRVQDICNTGETSTPKANQATDRATHPAATAYAGHRSQCQNGGSSVPNRLLISVAPWESRRSTSNRGLEVLRRDSHETTEGLRGGPRDGQVQDWSNRGREARRSGVPGRVGMGRARRGKRAKSHRLSKGLEIHDLGSSLGEKALTWAERLIFMSA
jgi:hypothetical protein